MSPSRIRIAATAAALATSALLLTGCVVPFPIPSGASTPASSEHDVSDEVHGLALETVADVEVRLGDEPALAISGSQSALERITVSERDGILSIGSEGPSFGLRSVRVTLTVTSFDELVIGGAGDVDADFSQARDVSITVRGAGDVDATGIDAESVSVVIDGAGTVNLEGTAASGDYRINGTGDIDASDLSVVDAFAEIDGAGEIDLHATGTADARSSGIGDIHIRGGADVSRQVDGLGTITEE